MKDRYEEPRSENSDNDYLPVVSTQNEDKVMQAGDNVVLVADQDLNTENPVMPETA